jgi:ABC-type oligopeptide transport system ATPase subunit
MWLHRKFLEQSYAGSISSDPYQDVVNKIAQSSYKTRSGLKKSQQDAIIYSLKNTILELDRKSKTFAEYGLKDASVSLDLISTIENTQGNKLNLIDAILQPYLDGLTAHFENLTPIYNLTNRFIGTINEFLKGKKLTYSVRDGIKIVVSARGKSTEIDPQQLSSGEQQLILLFCYVLVFQDSSSVIFIDEPEISLNVLWQRILITSLQNLSKDANIQFVFASHSIEILSKHRNRVISMEES